MELFRCVFIFLVVFLSALKVQSTRKVSIYHIKGVCKKEGGRYWAIDTATKTSINNITQCDARADGSTKAKAESRFQLVPLEIDGTIKCIQFTNRSSGEKYALKVVNQSRVVFEKHRCNGSNDPEEFQFKQEFCDSSRERFFVYKPFKNQSLCVSKDCVSQKLTLRNITQNETQDTSCIGDNKQQFDRLCIFKEDR